MVETSWKLRSNWKRCKWCITQLHTSPHPHENHLDIIVVPDSTILWMQTITNQLIWLITSDWIKRAGLHCNLKRTNTTRLNSKEPGTFNEHNSFLAPHWHNLIFIYEDELYTTFSSVMLKSHTEVSLLGTWWMFDTVMLYSLLSCTATVMWTRVPNCSCHLPEYRTFSSDTWTGPEHYVWLRKAGLLGNHGLCIALFSFTLLTWPCPLDKRLWWAVQEYQFGKKIFLQVQFSTLTH